MLWWSFSGIGNSNLLLVGVKPTFRHQKSVRIGVESSKSARSNLEAWKTEYRWLSDPSFDTYVTFMILTKISDEITDAIYESSIPYFWKLLNTNAYKTILDLESRENLFFMCFQIWVIFPTSKTRCLRFSQSPSGMNYIGVLFSSGSIRVERKVQVLSFIND